MLRGSLMLHHRMINQPRARRDEASTPPAGAASRHSLTSALLAAALSLCFAGGVDTGGRPGLHGDHRPWHRRFEAWSRGCAWHARWHGVGVLKRQDATAREQGLIFVAKEKVAIKLEEDKSISEVQSEAIMVWHLLSW